MAIGQYERCELWKAERYLENEAEQRRFNLTAQLIPEGVNSILDIGTGNGAFLRYLEDHDKCLTKMKGLEAAGTPIAKKVCRAEIYRGSIADLPFTNASFDLVSALEVIEHLPFGVFEKGLQEIQRVAARYILISVPYNERRIKVRCSYCGCNFNPDYHLRSFSGQALKCLFERFGLSKLIFVKKSYYPGIRFISQFLPERLRPSFSIEKYPQVLCPQCGFSPSRTTSLADPAFNTSYFEQHKIKKPTEFLKRLVPRFNRTYWSIMLYIRKA